VASERVEDQVAAGTAGGAGRPLLIVATFAAGAATALSVKAFLDSRRKPGSDDQNAEEEDLPTVLRRAALDVALAATSQAAERLASDGPEPQNEGAAEPPL
jgi:hypothetical protein